MSERYLVVGAGPSGLAATRQLAACGIPVVCLEQSDGVGGNWYYGQSHSSVSQSTHLISSKRLTEFPDFRMPRDYPHYPSHAQALAYLRSYAEHHGLLDRIEFRRRVERLEPAGSGWRVLVAGDAGAGEWRTYAGVLIANGHHWDPLYPEVAGDFAGEVMHAHDYKSPDVLWGKRVLVVGAGNSGCDIAVDAALHARSVSISLRRGYYFLPKYLFGAPLDRCGANVRRWPLPRRARHWLTRCLLHVAVGPPERYGLPRPDHPLFATHPIVNSQLPYFVGHGRVQVRPDVACFSGDRVEYTDGSRDEVDMVVYATGYRVRFPFLDEETLSGDTGVERLYLNVFHRTHANLFVVGLIQPNGGIWPLSDLQAQLIARLIRARQERREVAEWFDRLRRHDEQARASAERYVDSPRHRYEVDYFDYGDRLRKLIGRFDRATGGRVRT